MKLNIKNLNWNIGSNPKIFKVLDILLDFFLYISCFYFIFLILFFKSQTFRKFHQHTAKFPTTICAHLQTYGKNFSLSHQFNWVRISKIKKYHCCCMILPDKILIIHFSYPHAQTAHSRLKMMLYSHKLYGERDMRLCRCALT